MTEPAPEQTEPETPRGSVTVFGAGVAGMTAAHELAVRGFDVTVVEAIRAPGPDPESDELAIGGLAATQYDRGGNVRRFPVTPFHRDSGNRHGASDNQEQGEDGDADATEGVTLMGEHGYRFFPSYYQHLFDTMRRTPVFDHQGDETRFNTYDNIVPCTTQATVGTKPHPLLVIPRDPLTSKLEGDLSEVITKAGYRPTDILYLAERMIQYMSSSSERRKVYEQISSYDFFVGVDEPGAQPTIVYSPETDHQLNYMPKVLVAFDGKFGDARTNIDSWVQMMLNAIEQLPKTDGILNGPTSTVWLDHWRHLLEHELSVTFCQGTLEGLTVDRGQVVADVAWPQEEPTDTETLARRTALARPEYCVVATDAVTAESVTRSLPQVGVPRGLAGYTTTAPSTRPPGEADRSWDHDHRHHDHHDRHGHDHHRHDHDHHHDETEDARHRGGSRHGGHDGHEGHEGDHRHHRELKPLRNPQLSPGMEPWDRFQTLTGLQYFFDTEFDLIKGRVYFGESEWGISSVSQTPYWTHKPTVTRDGYATIVSVDVGNATTKSRVTHKTFLESTADEIAVEVWRQLTDDLGLRPQEIEHTIPVPLYYTIDRRLVFDEHGVCENKAPYLVPIVDDWDNRPGPEPWRPGGPADPSRHLERDVWQAGHGGSWIHFDSLVFAGTYLKTFTRLTTMESANESGRHAVNGILDHWLYKSTGDRRSEPGLDWLVPYGYGGDFKDNPVRQPTPIGDYCLIQNMENHEIPALDRIRKLDAEYFAAGLPHPFVMAGIEANTSISSQIVQMLSSGGYNGGFSTMWPSPEALLDKLRSYRHWLEDQLYGHGDHDHRWHDRHDHHDHHGRPGRRGPKTGPPVPGIPGWPPGAGGGLTPGLDQLLPLLSQLFGGLGR